MSDSGKAVFLSYASQDAEAAKRICDALRAAGVEVWFDAEGGLEHGDEWDAKIRRQIKECVLFVAVISANTESREEGYFRIEWDLAAQRARGIASGVAFILPVVIDGTKEQAALVPDRFRAVQWTKLPGGVVPADVLQRFLKLWSHRTGAMKHSKEQGAGSKEQGSVGGVLYPDGSEESGYKTPPTKSPGWKIYAGVAAGFLVLAASAIAWFSSKEPAAPPAAAAGPVAKAPDKPSEARQLEAQARALIDDDLMSVRENYRLADEFSRRAVALDATDGEVWATAARVSALILQLKYEMTPERKELAKIQVERAHRLAPASIETGLAQAVYQAVNGDAPHAERLLRNLILQAPADKRPWLYLGTILQQAERFDEALGLFHQAAGLLDGDPRAESFRGSTLVRVGRYREAEVVLGQVLRQSPTQTAYSWQLVLLGFYRCDLPAASRFLEQMPRELMLEDAMINLAAELWLRLGDGEKALKVLQKSPRDFLEEGFEIRPKGYVAGHALQLAGRPTAALAEWRQALVVMEKRLAANPNQPLLLYWEALLQALTGQKSAAIETRKLYRELEAKPDAWFDAILLVALGDNEQAIRGLLEGWPKANFNLRSDIRGDLMHAPWLAAIRQDPRIRALIAEQTAAIERDRAGPAAAALTPKIDEKSVAVLAFANLSSDPEQEYFSDGISEELLNVLAKVPGLNVRGRSSGFYFKGKQARSAEIGRQLAVEYLVQGSVRRAGDRVRISAQLIRAATDEVLWASGSLDRELKDIFAVQDEIARLIAQNLELKLGDRRARAKVVNPEAHRLVLEGRHYLALRGEANFIRGDAAFRAAAEIAPDMAVAHAGWAELVSQRGRYQQMAGLAAPGSQMEAVQGHVARALQLDPSLSEPHAALAVALVDAGRLPEAEVEMERGIAANPNYGSHYLWRAHLHAARGRLDTALSDLQRATDLDPLAFIHLYIRGAYLGYAGRWAEASPLLDRGASLRGERFLPLEGERALARFLTGRREEAMILARSVLADPEMLTLGWWTIGEALWVLRQSGAEDEAVRQGGVILAQFAPDNYLRGYVLCGLGRFEEGLPLLRNMPTIARNRFYFVPIFDPARETPAFKRLISDMKVETEYALARATLARLKPDAKK